MSTIRVPPHSDSVEMERAALGAALQSAEAAKALIERLRSSDYYHSKNGTIHGAIKAVLLCGGHVDLFTIGNALTERGQLEEIGGNYLAALVDETPVPSHYADYIAIVKKKATGRRVAHVLRQAAERAGSNGTDPGSVVADLWDELRDVQPTTSVQLPALEAPVAILRRARSQGDPISTGIPVLDDRTRGGMRPAKALAIGGTAGTGKTSLGLQIVKAGADQGCVVACLMVDEGREPAVIRLGQQFGFDRDLLEGNHEPTLEAMERDLSKYILLFPDPDDEADCTIEGVAEALVAQHPTQQKMLFIDSVQTVRTRRQPDQHLSLRERIMENARTARRLAVEYEMILIYTSEVNRSWYRARKEEDRASDLAAFAEARIEFSADVLLTMRASEDDPDLVQCRLPKNRLGHRAPFLMRLDRKRALFTPVEEDPRASMRERAHTEQIEKGRQAICQALEKQSGLTQTQLFQVVGGNRQAFFKALHEVKGSGLVSWEPRGRSVVYALTEVPQ